ncbi:MAG TPA: ABC transporter ATP-binding protein [Baekduia sp.]|nr:ABC transporter ATP-binding protein [Baekduia sp.]
MNGVEVTDLRVELDANGADIVDGVGFTVAVGEIVGVVGESGSGKTTVGTALLNGTRRGAQTTAGSIRLDGDELSALDENGWRRVRGKKIAYVPQDPTAALNPALRLRSQLKEMLDTHEPHMSSEDQDERIRASLREVKLPDTDEFLKRYPHQVSGGQLQRICLAMAFLLRPRLIVLDEPTTGLDVTTQAHVLDTVRELCANHSVAALYITHDLAVVGTLCDRVLVMYAGRIVESGVVSDVFDSPMHPYTRELLTSIPDLKVPRVLHAIGGYAPRPGNRPPGCAFAPRCRMATELCTTDPPLVHVGPGHDSLCHYAKDLEAATHRDWEIKPVRVVAENAILSARNISAFYGSTQVLHDVTVEVSRGECVALVGESGSGKTTLSRVIIGLLAPRTGEVTFDGETLSPKAGGRRREQRQRIQYIFQSPYSSLNPRHSIGRIIESPIGLLFDVPRAECTRRAEEAIEMVGLPAATLDSYPGDLSGGERQRVAIARALACEPTVLVCDEITSALDVSVQAGIVSLLDRLQKELELSLIFVTHNLALVRSVADRVAVLQDGRLVEAGATATVLDAPAHEYTKALLNDTPTMTDAIDLDPVAIDPKTATL